MNIYLLISWFLILLIAESIIPFRQKIDKKLRRVSSNLLYSLTNASLNKLIFIFALLWAERKTFLSTNWGGQWRLIFVFLLLDLLLYYWHRVNHEFPFFWRFHSLHHSDRDMDVSTAIRFHPGEMFFSMIFKILVILFTGITVREYVLFEIAVTSIVLFHHANIKIPGNIQKYLRFLIVTPLHHHYHHSNLKTETNSHYASIFPWWDHLHGTNQEVQASSAVQIGLVEYSRTPKFIQGLIQPFVGKKP